MLLRINDLGRPVLFEDADDVLDIFGTVTSGWSFARAQGDHLPAIRVTRERGRYVLEAETRRDPIREDSALSAACTLIVDLAEAFVDERPDLVCLHAGAARFGDGLVVFPSRRRAGKSTLIARLASLGVPAFADDILPLAETGSGLAAQALGVCSRLRLPLPPGLSRDFLAHCERLGGPGDRYYRYVLPEDGMLAPYGARAPVRAFVFLDRADGPLPATLHRADRRQAMEALLRQNFGVAAMASEILGRFERLLSESGIYVLRYAALDEAAALLIERFGSGEAHVQAAEPVPLPLPARMPRDTHRRLDPDAALTQAPGLGVRDIGGRTFLADDANGAILALEGLGGAIWELLAEPVSPGEIEAALVEFFSDVAPEVIRRDVGAFLGDLAERGLVRPAPVG